MITAAEGGGANASFLCCVTALEVPTSRRDVVHLIRKRWMASPDGMSRPAIDNQGQQILPNRELRPLMTATGYVGVARGEGCPESTSVDDTSYLPPRANTRTGLARMVEDTRPACIPAGETTCIMDRTGL